MNKKQLDRYSMMIVMKYFTSINDYYTIIQVCKKFQEIPDMFHYNPLPYSLAVDNLFPNIQTQYLYTYFDEKIEDIDRFTYMYCIFYKEYLEKPGSHKAHHLLHTNYSDKKTGSYKDIK